MGMFDSLYDAAGNEWQTKAFDCCLNSYRIGDRIVGGPPFTYQVEVLGGDDLHREFVDSHATVIDGALRSVNVQRDHSLPLLGYDGGWTRAANGA